MNVYTWKLDMTQNYKRFENITKLKTLADSLQTEGIVWFRIIYITIE